MIYFLGIVLLTIFMLCGFGLFLFLVYRSSRQGEFMENMERKLENLKQLKTKGWGNSLLFRSLLIVLLVILLQIPLGMVSDVVYERSQSYSEVLYEISNVWGTQQTLRGPFLIVPYTEKESYYENITGKNGITRKVEKISYPSRTAVFLPELLNIESSIRHEYRHRSIYESLVYEADLQLKGKFAKPDFSDLSKKLYRVDWEDAYLAMGISDTHAIKNVGSLLWNKKEKPLEPGTKFTSIISNGFRTDLGKFDTTKEVHEFSINLILNGSGSFHFAPLAKRTIVNMKSTWAHPSFRGSTLPLQHKISPDGFTARWDIPNLARTYPQSWATHQANHVDPNLIQSFVAGVSFFEPVDLYKKVTRSAKYAILFIVLTFLTFFIFELTVQSRLHFIQYTMVGLALCIFYLLLLSLSEHIGFFYSYGIASCAVIGMITFYCMSALAKKPQAFIVFGVLSALYGMLYFLLQIQDFALLVGSAILFLALGITMYVTRNLKTSNPIEENSHEENGQENSPTEFPAT